MMMMMMMSVVFVVFVFVMFVFFCVSIGINIVWECDIDLTRIELLL
jgi:outer membrane lipoprotein-sorting protein